MIYYLSIMYMLIFSFFFFMLGLNFMIFKHLMIMELFLMNILSVKIDYVIILDWISLIFISVVLMISGFVNIYSIEYLSKDLYFKRFHMLMILFSISMIFMIISPNLISILLGWDGLGLISYCLVIYYQNEVSSNSGMVTVLINRVGDIFIMMMIGLMMFMGSFNFMFFKDLTYLKMLMILIISFTKSAQIPFSSWLPKAMAAPTPVSSLVHSSTLVTAGVYLLIRFNNLISKDIFLIKLMMFISLMTMLMSGIMASMEFDLKKIIALSTLSQLGLMIFCLSLNLLNETFFHLIMHAMFKSMLFMCAGIFIHNNLLNQDIRFISMNFKLMPIVSMIFMCSSFSLMGIPFLSGFFSKDKILDLYMLKGWLNNFIFFMFFMSMGLTSGYSMRLIYYSFLKNSNINMFLYFKSQNSLMMYSMLILYLYTIFMGFIFSWLLFSLKNWIFLSIKLKLMIYLFMFMGLMLSLMFSMMYFDMLKLMMFYKIILMFNHMLFLNLLYKNFNFITLKLNNCLSFKMELGWNEYFFGLMLINLIKKLFKFDLIYNQLFYIIILIYYMMLMMMLMM
uniref:NADH-ubiquinone oxidoreductase chain 5 n=2 Tax=Ichneumonidae sp. MT-2014 TaxID=1560014 RepID=A0A0A0RX05_9HYME|nr:NADH dehydrogenase subunit 5 [Ichneumonidae sp. MT-2014]